MSVAKRVGIAMVLASMVCAAVCSRAAQAFEWTPIANDGGKVVVGGVPFEPENAHKPWSVARAANSATEVFRFEVRAGDMWSEDVESGENKERSEFDGYSRRWSGKTPVWGSYAFLIEPGQPYASDWTSIMQMHGSEARPFSLQFTNEALSIFTEHLEAGTAVQKRVYLGALKRGAWHNAVFRLVQSSSSDGMLEFWLDGQKILKAQGPVGTDANKTYSKFGIYRGYGPIQAAFAVEYANIEIGDADLSGRIANPPPIR